MEGGGQREAADSALKPLGGGAKRDLQVLLEGLERLLLRELHASGPEAPWQGGGGAEAGGCVPPLISLFYPFAAPTLLRIARASFAGLQPPPRLLLLRHVREPWLGRRLRLGLLTSDFGDNSVGRELMALVLNLRRERSWAACISMGFMGKGDAHGTVVGAGAAGDARAGAGGGAGVAAFMKMQEVCGKMGVWVDVSPMPLRAAVEAVNAQRLHLLVDVQGWSGRHGMRLLAARPAPLQVYPQPYKPSNS